MIDPLHLYAGTLENFDDSMAKEIEDAFALLMGPLPDSPASLVEDRRKLFIAISRGVINHLAAKHQSLTVTFDVGLDHFVETVDVSVRT